MTQPGTEPRSPRLSPNTLNIMPMEYMFVLEETHTYIYIHLFPSFQKFKNLKMIIIIIIMIMNVKRKCLQLD